MTAFAVLRAGEDAKSDSAVADVATLPETGQGHDQRLGTRRPLDALRSVVIRTISAFLLLWVAIYNGCPTVFPDTGGYLYAGAFGVSFFPFRAPGYGVFAMTASLGKGLWFTVVAQSIIVVIVLYELCRFLIADTPRFRDYCFLGTVTFLAAVSSLPWQTSLVMPDVFAGVVFLALLLQAFAKLNPLDRIVLGAISALGVSGHASLLPIAALFVGALAVVRWRRRPASTDAPSMKFLLPWLMVPLLAAGLWTANLNRRMGLGFKLSPATNDFLFGRLLNDGLVPDFLRANCPARPFVACGYLGNLPKTPEEFFFWHPLRRDMSGDEEREIVRGTLASYPLRFAWNSTRHTLRQLVQFKTGDEVRALELHAVNPNGTAIDRIFPRDLRAYSASKLIRGRLVSLTKIVAGVDTTVFWLSAIGCVMAAFWQRDEEWNWFFYSGIVFLVLNAAVCATFAGVYDRYQARVAWIMPLCFAMIVCRGVADKHAD